MSDTHTHTIIESLVNLVDVLKDSISRYKNALEVALRSREETVALAEILRQENVRLTSENAELRSRSCNATDDSRILNLIRGALWEIPTNAKTVKEFSSRENTLLLLAQGHIATKVRKCEVGLHCPKILAIKFLREVTGTLGLREAKDIVDPVDWNQFVSDETSE